MAAEQGKDGAADGCPVDHNARAAWLEKAAQAGDAARAPHPLPPTPPPSTSSSSPSSSSSSWSWKSLLFASPQSSPSSSASSSQQQQQQQQSSSTATANSSSTSSSPSSHTLGLERVISTIPRAPSSPSQPSSSSQPSPSSSTTTTTTATTTATSQHSPSNHEQETGASESGNWVYPSERMFFEAMRRKQHSPRAADMAAVVPIHNAVNERAWAEIKAWEARFAWVRAANARCGGPRLASFSGDSSRLSPRARLNALLGYQAPFDRHDWVVERCNNGGSGTGGFSSSDSVEYVIDFYQGRDDGRGKGLNFYLDVRPKLNSWEGCKMRLLSLMGW